MRGEPFQRFAHGRRLPETVETVGAAQTVETVNAARGTFRSVRRHRHVNSGFASAISS